MFRPQLDAVAAIDLDRRWVGCDDVADTSSATAFVQDGTHQLINGRNLHQIAARPWALVHRFRNFPENFIAGIPAHRFFRLLGLSGASRTLRHRHLGTRANRKHR